MKKNTFCPSFSHDEWQLIVTALKPYRHNKEYRALLEQLQDQFEHRSDPPADCTRYMPETKNAREG